MLRKWTQTAKQKQHCSGNGSKKQNTHKNVEERDPNQEIGQEGQQQTNGKEIYKQHLKATKCLGNGSN